MSERLDPADSYCLAIDQGTGGPKVGLASLAGEIVWKDHLAVATERDTQGRSEQDAGEWWAAITDATKRAVAGSGLDPASIVALSVTGQWASTVPVDAEGVPVGPCVMWQDTRGGRHARAQFGGPALGYAPTDVAAWIRRTGGAPSPQGNDPVGHMLLIENEMPEVARAARWYLEPVDAITMRFTGKAAASHASMTAAWLTDNRDLSKLDYDAGLLKRAGVDASKLPPLARTGSVVGTVRDDVADALGLPHGIRAVTGTPDLHTAACGAGAVQLYDTHLAISTSAWIGAPVPEKKTDVFHQIAAVPGLTGDTYLIANNHETGGVCLEWLRDTMFPGSTYDELTTLAATAAPGAGNVLFTPWLNGERSPVEDTRARAGFHNLSLTTTRADLVRSLMEGVAYNNRWLHGYVEKFAGRRLDRIRIIGGGAVSDLWCQIHADVMDRTFERTPEPLHANLRGAAVFAGLALGALEPGDVAGVVGVERTFRPDPERRALYDRLFREFPELYARDKKMFARLNAR